jgi:hypothetical protein
MAVLAAGLRHVGAAAATAADDFGDVAHETTGMDASAGQVLGNCGNQLGTFLDYSPNNDHTATQPVAEQVGHLAQGFNVGCIDFNRQDGYIFDLDSSLHKSMCVLLGELLAQLCDFALQLLVLFGQLTQRLL